MAPVIADGLQVALDARTHEQEMVDYIKTHFGGMLGADAALLETPGGLDELAARLHARARTFGRK
jgi:hypothetical protein